MYCLAISIPINSHRPLTLRSPHSMYYLAISIPINARRPLTPRSPHPMYCLAISIPVNARRPLTPRRPHPMYCLAISIPVNARRPLTPRRPSTLQEYGMSTEEKLAIAQSICAPLMKKILCDLHANSEEESTRLDGRSVSLSALGVYWSIL